MTTCYEYVVYPPAYNPTKHEYFSYKQLRSARHKASAIGVGSQIWGFANVKGNPFWYKHLLTKTPTGFLLKNIR